MIVSSGLLFTIAMLFVAAVGLMAAADEKVRAAMVSLSLAAVLSIFVTVFFYLEPSLVQSIPNIIFLIMIVVIAEVGIAYFTLTSIMDVDVKTPVVSLVIIGGLAIGSIVIIFADFGRASFYDSATKQIEVLDENSKIDLLAYNEDVDKIAMSKTYARYLFGKAMNQVENSELFEINSVQIQVIDGTVYYVADLKYTSYWKWSEKKEFPGYFKLDASSTTSKVEFVKEPYVYASSAYFGNNAERKIRQDAKTKYFVGEPTIEIDDKGKVFYTMTLANPINMQNGLELYGVYVLDAVSGEGKTYKKNELPAWVDGGITPAYAYEVADYYATWNKGRFNWSGKGQKAMNTNGNFDNMKPILIDGQLHYFIEFSTLKNQGNNSMVGYLVMNTRNGEFYLKETKDESLIDSSGANSQAEKAYVEKKYDSKNPLLYNVDGNMAWVTSLHDGDGLFQNFYVVSATNPSVNASGSNIEAAMDNFLKAIKNNTSLVVDEDSIEEKEVTITVTNKLYENAGEYHYLYLEDDNGKMYVYTSEKAEKIIMIQPGQKVKMTFKDLGDDAFSTIISVQEIIK